MGGSQAIFSYDAYGNRTDDPNNLWLYNPFGYAGQYTDQESGLVYMRARYYDPATEQFISRDPMEGVSGQPYVYAGASPLNATDVSGRFLDTLFDIAGVGLDVKDIADNGLSWENGLTLVADVGLALVPIAPAAAGAAARGAKALAHADDVGDATRGGTEFVERAMSRAELQATRDTGLIRGGRPGTHYVSNAVNHSARRARLRLALPVEPEVRVLLEVPAGVFSPPSKVAPFELFNRVTGKFLGTLPGGGMERWATGDIPARVVNVWEYK